ncbi:hypothetical protein ACB092_12G152600 [Castanea dentata]
MWVCFKFWNRGQRLHLRFTWVGNLSTIHGPNYLAISAKARQELLSAIQEAMNMEFSNPAERRYVTQISASPRSISLSNISLQFFCFRFLNYIIE